MYQGPMRALHDIFGRSRDLVLLVDGSGAIAYHNPPAAVRARDVTRAATWFSDEHQAAFEAALAKVRATGEAARFDWGEARGDVVAAWFIAELTPIEDGVLCVSRDITERERTRRRLRRSEQMMVDAQGVAHLGTWEWDITQPTATWSAELYRIYGLTPETYTPSYEAYLTMIHEDDRQRVIDATNRVFHEHVAYSHDERIFRPDGSIRHLHTWAYPVLDDSGTLTHLIGVCQDITDRAEAEEALQRLNAELEQRVADRTRELEAFNAMISHDLRVPLSVVQMAADLMSASGVDEGQRKHIDRILRAVKAMTTLMDDLLTFARVGSAAFQPQELDVSALCTDVLAELRTGSSQRTVELVVAPDLRCTADPTLFRSVLANLLGNAWKYTGEQPIARIEVTRVDDAGTPALQVRDNGVGFDMSEQHRLFAPFERLSSARRFAGTGLGLAIAKKIVERHGGHLKAESAVGQGATFFVGLPGETWSPR